MWARMPAFFAAMWKRAAPEMLSRSRMARAGKSSAAARAISSSGTEEPSRKLKALRAWSSVYGGWWLVAGELVIGAFDEPIGIGVDAVERTIRECDVPCVAIPCAG